MDKVFFDECIKKISPFIDKEARDEAVAKFNENDIAKVAEILLTKYYDKVYKKNKNKNWYKLLSWFVTMNLVMIGFFIFSGEPYKILLTILKR